jgi:O-antigen ligase
MVARLRLPAKTFRTAFLIAVIAALAVIAAFASIALEGTKTGAVLSIGTTLGPVLLYAAIVSPILFPFGIYAAVTPLDTLLTLPAFGTATKILGIVTAGAMLFYLIRTKRGVQPPPVAALWLIFYLWATTTLWWAIDTDPTFRLLGISWSLLLLFLVSSMFRPNRTMLSMAVGAVLTGAVICALYGLYFFHNGQNLNQTGGRLWIQTQDSQINPDHFANSFILPASLALVGALWSKRWFAKTLYAVALLLMLLVIALTGSRGAMLGFGTAVLFLLIKDRHRVQLTWFVGLGGLLGAVVGGPMLASRFQNAISTGGAGRTEIWRAGWAAFKHFWMLGAGYGNFPLAYNQFYLSVFQPTDPHFGRASHDILLNAAVETGIIGLILLVTCWVQTFRLLDPIGENDYRFPLRLALQGAIAGLFVTGLFADLMITKYVWLAFMLTVMTYNAAPVVAPARERHVLHPEVAVPSSA